MTLPFSSQYFNGTAGLTQGGWIIQATELRCAHDSYAAARHMLYGGGQWGAPAGEGPLGQGNGGQIYGQYSPPNGPLAIECQMPVYETAVQAMVAAPTSTAHGSPARACKSLGIWPRLDAQRCRAHMAADADLGQPDGCGGSGSQPGAYTDSVTGVTYVFAGSR